MSTAEARWKITRTALGLPMRVEIPAEEDRKLTMAILEFCRATRTRKEIDGMLLRLCDCPPDRINALRMSLIEPLRGLYGRPCLMDNNFFTRQRGEPMCDFTTELGIAWLEEQQKGTNA